jgi:hypothetical protein
VIERLQKELTNLEGLSPDEQEELALFIEALRHAHEAVLTMLDQTQPWQNPAGAWSDLLEDDEAETFYCMRHKAAPRHQSSRILGAILGAHSSEQDRCVGRNRVRGSGDCA